MEFCGPHRAAYEKLSDDVPFELPKGWAWCRWGDISQSVQYGYNAPAMPSGRIRMVRITDIQDGRIKWDSVPYCQIEEARIPSYKLQMGDILFARTGGTVGKSHLINETPLEAVYAGYLVRTQCASSILPRYAKLFLESELYWEQLKVGMVATAQPNFNGEKLSAMLLPLPPLAEQKRIVAAIDELFRVLDSLGAAAGSLEAAAKRLDKKILDLAIHGKLVPQNPTDEPASELMKRIATTSHKSPCKNQETPIDPPFAIPESWEWAKLGEIISLLSGRDLSPSDYSSFVNQFPYITGASNFVDGRLVVNRWTDKAITISHNGDLLITCKGTIGAMAINNIGDIHIARQIMAISSSGMDLKFIKIFLESAISTLKDSATSMIPGIDRNTVLNLLIPVPPLSEQKRIVTRVQEARDILALLFP